MDLPFNRILFKVEGEMTSHVNNAVKHNVGAWPCFSLSPPDISLGCLLLSLWYHPCHFLSLGVTCRVYVDIKVELESCAAHRLSVFLIITATDLLMPAVVTYLSSVNINMFITVLSLMD